MRRSSSCALSAGVLLGVLVSHSPAAAQAARNEPSAQGAAPQDEARSRFQRALELAEDGNFDAALVELRKAYELAPTFRILYNVGLVQQQLRDYARSLDAYEQYLDEGGAQIDEERVREVSARIERLKGRVGYITVTVSEPGAEITVDDVVIGTSPLSGPVRVNSGARRVTAKLPGRPAESRVVELAGGERKDVSLDLRILTVSSPPPPPKSIVPWVSWGVTAALAGATTVTGLMALGATSDYDAIENRSGVSKAEMLDADDKRRTMALVTDILGGATLVAAGVSVYFTIKPPKPKTEETSSVELYTTGQSVGGRFRF